MDDIEKKIRDHYIPNIQVDPIKYKSNVIDFPETDFNLIMHHLTKELNRLQEEVLRGVLKQILGREPEIQDAKLLTIIRYPSDMLDYTLAYGGSEIGRVVFENEMTKWTITFKPYTEMPELFESREPKV